VTYRRWQTAFQSSETNKGPWLKDYKIRKAIKSPDILKKESAKVESCYNKVARRVIALFRQLVYYNYNKVKFEEFKHIREKADKID
jgi:hypothetical protein